MYSINIQKQELSTAETYGHTLIGENCVVVRHRCYMYMLLSLVYSLMSIIESFLRYTRCLNFKKINKSRLIANSSPCTTTVFIFDFLFHGC